MTFDEVKATGEYIQLYPEGATLDGVFTSPMLRAIADEPDRVAKINNWNPLGRDNSDGEEPGTE